MNRLLTDTKKVSQRTICTLTEFRQHGYVYRRLDYNPDLDIYLFGVWSHGQQIAWEVVKPVKSRGEMVYPSSSQFGVYGKCVSFSEVLRPKMEGYFNNGW